MKDKIFHILIKHSVSLSSTCGMPLSSIYLADRLNISQYECLKYLHQLKEENLVEVVRGAYYDEYYGKNFLYCGWYITNKAHHTQIYKEEERKAIDMITRS